MVASNGGGLDRHRPHTSPPGVGSAHTGQAGPRRGRERVQPRQRRSAPELPAQSSQRCGKARLATSMAPRRTLSSALPRKFDNGLSSPETATHSNRTTGPNHPSPRSAAMPGSALRRGGPSATSVHELPLTERSAVPNPDPDDRSDGRPKAGALEDYTLPRARLTPTSISGRSARRDRPRMNSVPVESRGEGPPPVLLRGWATHWRLGN